MEFKIIPVTPRRGQEGTSLNFCLFILYYLCKDHSTQKLW